jgi:mannosyl-oligosaccharide alpha-1,2-mannosidase
MLHTPVDALDTLYIMGLHDEYKQAKKLVLEKLSLKVPVKLKVFETNIRVLGGLLAAYELEGDKALLKKAIEVGDLFKHAFDTPTGIPYPDLKLGTYQPENKKIALSEVGSMQLELLYLSDVTGDSSYADMVQYSVC